MLYYLQPAAENKYRNKNESKTKAKKACNGMQFPTSGSLYNCMTAYF